MSLQCYPRDIEAGAPYQNQRSKLDPPKRRKLHILEQWPLHRIIETNSFHIRGPAKSQQFLLRDRERGVSSGRRNN
ncbi:hypothetical protein FLAG1_06405 [Fusarium langsethiae]|uniref:Uncharacterized protein n=1 Tax=Fusarium langsethiae TaxID=179993 RepID=A0A0N0V6Q4_FUSLA|nr:hypothetical protein FLAG1_06405 [Fusarium langsethiae]